MKCHLIDFESADWKRMDGFADRTVFQTQAWVRFVSQCQRAAPVLGELREGGEIVGYFTGLTFTKLGVKVLGSSFPGWTTPYMGFNLAPGESRAAALRALEITAWDKLKCLHIEVSDPYFVPEDGLNLGFQGGAYESYRTDLTKLEDEIFSGMSSACRRCIRKAEKSGVTIEEAHDPAFADEYYAQLKDVFGKQGLVPTYDIGRVRSLIEHLGKTDRLLLLRARDAQGQCIATGIFPGFNGIAEFWGNASFRSSQILRPNELIHWYAMRYWKRRGIAVYDWGGGGTYKEKYGCVPYSVPWFSKSRYQFVSRFRDEAKKMFERKQRFLGWLQGRRADDAALEE
jgi:hypothetical protein